MQAATMANAPAATGPSGAALLSRARALEAARPDTALALVAAAGQLEPGNPDVALVQAGILLRAGRPDDARLVLDATLDRDPNQSRALLLRAEAWLLRDRPDRAAGDAADALILSPQDPAAKATLGIALAELGRAVDACTCLAEAVRGDPGNPAFHEALARAQAMGGDPDEARATLDHAIALRPDAARLHVAAAKLALERGDPARAEAIARRARDLGVADARIAGLLGHALSSLGHHEGAGEAYAEALMLAPEDAYVRHLAAASGRAAAPERASEDYVRTVFDGYASRFDAHLLALGYRVPGLLRRLVLAHTPVPALAPPAIPGGSAGQPDQVRARLGPVLDLGCRTGLAAVAMSDLAIGPWHGVDLSPKMLREAGAKALYATLTEADVESWLAGPGERYPLIIAADVFCYLGSLTTALRGVAGRLSPTGILVASFEALESGSGGSGQAWRLGPRGRYCHSVEYITQAAHESGLTVLAQHREMLRLEGERPVPGWMIAFSGPVPRLQGL